MDKRWIIDRQGKEFVLYPGLLDAAHRHGLCRITTTVLQMPADANGHLAIVAATVHLENGIFDGIGDASPDNVGRMIAPHIVRMAETRAKARALRDALNINMLVEGDEDMVGALDTAPARTAAPPQQAAPQAVTYEYLMNAARQIAADTGGVVMDMPDEDTPEGNRAHLGYLRQEWQRMTDTAIPATEQQRQRIAALNAALGHPAAAVAGLSAYGAARLINQLAVEQAQRARVAAGT